jgi:hypothetical protein
MRRYRTPVITWLLALAVSTGLVLGAQVLAVTLPTSFGAAVLPNLSDHKWQNCAIGVPTAQSIERRRTLILHDRGGVGSDAGAAYATLMANLASHFGPVEVARATTISPATCCLTTCWCMSVAVTARSCRRLCSEMLTRANAQCSD